MCLKRYKWCTIEVSFFVNTIQLLSGMNIIYFLQISIKKDFSFRIVPFAFIAIFQIL